ncbi:MAG: 50S ribosomal protein L11 methyltransferase [Balneola sp.]|nr:50S ribosomal protein L11 methyltransferase [Balneola sp.]
MNQAYLELQLALNNTDPLVIIAELNELGFSGFDETEALLKAYIDFSVWIKVQKNVKACLASFSELSIVAEYKIEHRNWNEDWEKKIQPQLIGSFYVYPSWNKKVIPADTIPIVIDPKMAFGTGTHETTRLLLSWLPSAVKKNDKILDAGTGTGILGIAASKLGACMVEGFDIDPWSIENVTENIDLNNVDNFKVYHGSIEQINPDQQFDMILANINIHALRDLLPMFKKYLNKYGSLLISGLLSIDIPFFKDQVIQNEFIILEQNDIREWSALWLKPIVY